MKRLRIGGREVLRFWTYLNLSRKYGGCWSLGVHTLYSGIDNCISIEVDLVMLNVGIFILLDKGEYGHLDS